MGNFAGMAHLTEEIQDFLRKHGFECRIMVQEGAGFIQVRSDRCCRMVLPVEICATDVEEAQELSQRMQQAVGSAASKEEYPLVITEDRWRGMPEMTGSRLLSHLEVFTPVYARNCEVRRIEKDVAREFLTRNHSYGYAACRYCYGLFFKRFTGAGAEELTGSGPEAGQLIAVASFSNARKWLKEGKEIRSYEWTRYASLPHLRINGGMGKILKAFIRDVQPDDIMSYADLEWSEGNVYQQLGFAEEGNKAPVCFEVDTSCWKRRSLEKPDNEGICRERKHFCNFGSRKFRLKLTEY